MIILIQMADTILSSLSIFYFWLKNWEKKTQRVDIMTKFPEKTLLKSEDVAQL